MEKVNVSDTNDHLCALLERIERGERILFTRHGIPVAQLIPVMHPKKRMTSLASFRAKITKTKTSPLDVLEALREESR